MSDETTQKVGGVDEPEEWYVLAGISGRTLKAAYVKQQYDANKVKIRGPFSQSTIIKYYQNRMIAKDTILFREGGTEWKPFASYNLARGLSGSTGIAERIKIPGVSRERFANLVDTIRDYVRTNKVVVAVVLATIALGFISYDYYYYKPEQIYDRIKGSVVMVSTEDGFGRMTGLGSGFFVDDGGIVATNLHVIEGSTVVRIKTGKQSTYDVEGVVFVDDKNDLALLKIKKRNRDEAFKGIPIGSLDRVKIGERVYAVGNPAGMEFSLSEGIVSGKRTEDPIRKEARELLQITAPISPGNSGGPVLDKKGQVIAVATLASGNNFQNLNFAVPLSLLGDIAKYKSIEYMFLPTRPNWTPVDVNMNYNWTPYGSSQPIQRDTVNTYYCPETITRRGDNVRTWVRANVQSRTVAIDHFGAQRQSVQHDQLTGLIEIDCKQNAYRFNILFGTFDDVDSDYKTNFSANNKWSPVEDDDKKLIRTICDRK